MNPYGISGRVDPAPLFVEIEALYRQTQASIDEYWTHPFAYCTHNGNCTRRFRRWGVR